MCNKPLTRKSHMLLRYLQILFPLLWFFKGDAVLHIPPGHISIYPDIIRLYIHYSCLTGIIKYMGRHYITNMVFPKSNTPVFSKVLSKMALHVARLVPPTTCYEN